LIRQLDIESFVAMMTRFCDELHDAEAELNEVYPEVLADARQRLVRLFNPADYPSEVRGLFDVQWDFPAVEPPGYLMRLNPEVFRQEQERVARRFEEAVQLAEQAFRDEFARLVSHLTERLSGSEGEAKIFRDSAVTNLVEFFEKFKRLNLNSNEQLDTLVDEAQNLVKGVTPDALRTHAGLRQRVATQMAQVQTQLDQLIITAPRRRLVRASPSANGNIHAPGH